MEERKMTMKKKGEESGETRRNMLKKVGIASSFVMPTLMTFTVSDLKAANSGGAFKIEPNKPVK